MTTLTLLPSGRKAYPGLTVGAAYPYLRDDVVAGYVFIEVMGRPLCVEGRHFEPAAPTKGGLQPDGSYILDCGGNERFERGEAMTETVSREELEEIVFSRVEALTGSRVGYSIQRVKDAAPGELNWDLVGATRDGWNGLPNHQAVFAALNALEKRYRLA